jgi:homoserine kinase
MRTVRVYVPGSIGNVGPGLDIMGLALAGAGDTLLATRTRTGRVVLSDPGHPLLPRSVRRHAAAIAARAVLRRAGLSGRVGLELALVKGLPLAGGQGGSAASAVAGAYAANALVGRPLDWSAVLLAALEAETAVAGPHLDNLAPSLLGGLVLITRLAPPELICLEPPRRLVIVLAKPDYELATRRGRAVLPPAVPRAIALEQAAHVAAMVVAAARNDVPAFGRAVRDRIAEPARAPLLPGFLAAKRAALRAGAYGCSISGSGPTMFAVTDSIRLAREVARAIRQAYGRAGHQCEIRVARPDERGAREVGGTGKREKGKGKRDKGTGANRE